MLALTLTPLGPQLRNDCAPRSPQPGEVEIRVRLAGICETDLQLIRGYLGFHGVLGHEFVGTAVSGPWAGRRVVGEINCNCRRCEYCAAGLGNHCPERTVVGIVNHDGAFAERLWLPQPSLHLVPDQVSDDEAVFVEPLAAAFQIPAQIDLRRFRNCLVLGDGRLGNLCAQVLMLHEVEVTVVGKHASKLAVLNDLGIPTRRLAELDDARRITDLVVDCTGSLSGFPTACRLVRPRGTIILKTTVAGDTGPALAPVVIDELTIVGSRCGPFDRAIEALTRREVAVQPLISARYPLTDGLAALQAAATPPNLKVLLDVSPG